MMPVGYYIRNVATRIALALAVPLFWFCCWLGCALLRISQLLGRKPRREDF